MPTKTSSTRERNGAPASSGLHRYARWPLVPDHLKSRTALRRAGLAPEGPPVAEVFQRMNHRVIALYDEREARPRRPASPAQLAALEKANAVRRRNLTCVGCGRVARSYEAAYEMREEPDLCMDCANEPAFAARVQARRMLKEPGLVILELAEASVGAQNRLSGVAVLTVTGDALLATAVATDPAESLTSSMDPLFPEATPVAPSYAEVYPQLHEILASASRILTWDQGRICRVLDEALCDDLAPEEGIIPPYWLTSVGNWWEADDHEPSLKEACEQASITRPYESSALGRAQALLSLVRATAADPNRSESG